MKRLFKKFLYATTIWELKKYRTEDEVYAEWIDGWKKLPVEFMRFVFSPLFN
jgi:hypothetical protein